MRLSVIFIITLIFIIPNTFPSNCQRGFGVFYDELHSFNVKAPKGWCVTNEDKKFILKPQSRSPDSNEIQMAVWYTYLTDERRDYDILIRDELSTLTGEGQITTLQPLHTKNDKKVQVFSISNPNQHSYCQIGFLLHKNICLIRFLLSTNDPNILTKTGPDFKALISSYSSNI